jgi:hypothetical protein
VGKAPNNAAAPAMPSADVYTRLETIGILGLVFVFILLFVWLTFRGDQDIYQYYVFALMTTLMFCGILKSVGAYRQAGVALGGSIVTFDANSTQKKTIGDLSAQLVTRDSEKRALKTNLDELQERLRYLMNQDITIFTFRIDQSPMKEVIVKYSTGNGEPGDAKRDGIKHVVPVRDLLSGAAIRVEYDPASLPEERKLTADGRSTSDIRINRLSYKISPLELHLYLMDQ